MTSAGVTTVIAASGGAAALVTGWAAMRRPARGWTVLALLLWGICGFWTALLGVGSEAGIAVGSALSAQSSGAGLSPLITLLGMGLMGISVGGLCVAGLRALRRR